MSEQSQAAKTVALQNEDSISLQELVETLGNIAWVVGWFGVGIAVVTAFTSPPSIVEHAGGTITIQGVDFRVLLASFFLMGFRTVIPGLFWLRKKAVQWKH